MTVPQETLIHAVVLLCERGRSQREIATELGISRGKVRRILERAHKGRTQGVSAVEHAPARLARASKLDPFKSLIEELVEEFPDITAVRLHEELEEAGFSGSYTIVKEHLRALNKRPKKKPVIRFETGPAAQGQQDWSPYKIDFLETGKAQVSCFSLILSFSRRQYIDFTASEDFFAMIRQHVRAFEYFGGVPHEILYDNQKTVVARREAGRPIYNPRFLAFATHYRFIPRALPPRRPELKGKVERPFQYVEGNCLNARRFRDLPHLREHARWWMTQVSDTHVHQTTGASPIERFEEERDELTPLPVGPYDTAEVGYRVVTEDGFVHWDGTRYSVPYEHILDMVVVRDTGEEICIHGNDLKIVAQHAKASSGVGPVPKAIEDPMHRPVHKARRDIDLLAQRLIELGEAGEAFATGILRTKRYRGAELAHVLGLMECYDADDLMAALGRAVRYKAFDAKTVERILERSATKRPLPSTLDLAMAKRLSDVALQVHVEPRPLDDYARALGSNPVTKENDDD